MINLFPDQIEFVDAIRQEIKSGSRSVLGVASTGFGKTIVSAYLTRSAEQKGNSAWFMCHRKNLLKQTSQAFWKLHIEHGLIASGRRQSVLPVQVATVGTLNSRLDKLQPPQLLIVDEAHLSMAATWVKVVDWCKERGSIVIGNSATPERLDGKGLGYLFDSMVEAKPMRWLIDNGRLSDYELYSAVPPDLKGVKTVAGDYSLDQLAAAMDKPKLIGDAVAHWKKLAYGLRTIAYCVNIEHSKHCCDLFNLSGIPAVHVDGTSTDAVMQDAIEGFADGRYMVLFNCQLMTEGFDLSAQVNRDVPIEACILLRPTQSLALYMQMVGRALRVKPKPAVILDHAGCAMRHGLPDDEREWSLAGRKKRKRGDQEPPVSIQQCGFCYGVFRPGVDICPLCGAPVEKKERPTLAHDDGELVKINVEASRKQKRQEVGMSRSIDELVALGHRRGMKDPAGWAANVYAGRHKRRPFTEEYHAARQAYIKLRSTTEARKNEA